ncbi:hydroxyisourate hydrolase [Burkholderia guangdongensis]|uniref:hydroxyisourate hydrolase n=1 Tax=Burkholderia guangdongensis TaxID=1792500 RepID=UPI0015CE3F8D|nr:hydroxyisourate hydrolase [Burkholderia guangdongensis]
MSDNPKPFDASRRRFALQSMTLGGSVLLAGSARAASPSPSPSPSPSQEAAAVAPNQTAGPVQQDGLSPRLTMHGLDTWHGVPAAGLRVELFGIEGGAGGEGGELRHLRTVTLAPSGRSEPPLLIGDAYRVGTYELVLHVDEYFAQRNASLPEPPFLSKIPVRFRVTDATQRIHLPVLFGPWNYNYYRGS